jgi:hypothetical protein
VSAEIAPRPPIPGVLEEASAASAGTAYDGVWLPPLARLADEVSGGDYAQVLRPVVPAVAVQMANDLISTERATERFFCDEAVLMNPTPATSQAVLR